VSFAPDEQQQTEDPPSPGRAFPSNIGTRASLAASTAVVVDHVIEVRTSVQVFFEVRTSISCFSARAVGKEEWPRQKHG